MKRNRKIGIVMAIVVIIFSGATDLSAQKIKKDKLKVYGNCGMCEERIEEAAGSLDGVKSASWDEKYELLFVRYSPEKVTMKDISRAIADVGHDTEMHEADDKIYNNLHACCRYRE